MRCSHPRLELPPAESHPHTLANFSVRFRLSTGRPARWWGKAAAPGSIERIVEPLPGSSSAPLSNPSRTRSPKG